MRRTTNPPHARQRRSSPPSGSRLQANTFVPLRRDDDGVGPPACRGGQPRRRVGPAQRPGLGPPLVGRRAGRTAAAPEQPGPKGSRFDDKPPSRDPFPASHPDSQGPRATIIPRPCALRGAALWQSEAAGLTAPTPAPLRPPPGNATNRHAQRPITRPQQKGSSRASAGGGQLGKRRGARTAGAASKPHPHPAHAPNKRAASLGGSFSPKTACEAPARRGLGSLEPTATRPSCLVSRVSYLDDYLDEQSRATLPPGLRVPSPSPYHP